MNVEGVKKWHLILSSLLYLFLIISLLGMIGFSRIGARSGYMLFERYLYPLFILGAFATVALFFIGFVFLIYYFVKKEEVISKFLSISNITLSFFHFCIFNFFGLLYVTSLEMGDGFIRNIDVYIYCALIVYVLSFFFTLYLYWSREKSKTKK